jgi:hypothetical protein
MNLCLGNLFTSLQGVSHITVKVSSKKWNDLHFITQYSRYIKNSNRYLRCLWLMIVKAIVFCDGMSCRLTDSSKYYLLTTVQKTITLMLKHIWHFSLAVIFYLCTHVCIGACTWVGENWLCPFWLWTTYLKLSCQNMSEYVALIFTSDYFIWEVLIISPLSIVVTPLHEGYAVPKTINECHEWTWIHLEYVMRKVTDAMKIDIGVWHHSIW